MSKEAYRLKCFGCPAECIVFAVGDLPWGWTNELRPAWDTVFFCSSCSQQRSVQSNAIDPILHYQI